MGELVGKASACLREAASAKAGASHLTAVRSLEERFTYVRFCNHWVNLRRAGQPTVKPGLAPSNARLPLFRNLTFSLPTYN
jgi:hypothetical protein